MKFLLLCFTLWIGSSFHINLIDFSDENKPSTLDKHIVDGQIIDKLNGVPVYYNGKMGNVHGRHLAANGYNFGLKWQCVEFVKRYYFRYLKHQMPNSYGHARDFFDKNLQDAAYNKTRGLLQFKNARYEAPKVNDILVFNASDGNPFGHIAIISNVHTNEVEIVQQNWGTQSRQIFKLIEFQGIYTIAHENILGWLRMPDSLNNVHIYHE